MRRSRIAFVITSAVSFNTLMRGQLEYLRSRGARIDLYCGGPAAEREKLRRRSVGTVRHVPFRRQPSPLWDLFCLLWLTALFAVRRYDTVVYSTPKAMLVGALAAFLTAQPRRIAMVRGRGYENFTGRKRRIYVALDRLTSRLSHEVLFISRSLTHAYEVDGIRLGSKAVLLGHGSSNGVDLERFGPLSEPQRNAVRRQLALEEDAFVIVVVGRLRDYKGTPEVLELARRLRDLDHLRILLVGPIEDDRTRIEIEGADREQVRWFPPSSDVERYFQAADLHLFLSHREGFGNVAIEAAACGVPTFAFGVVGIRDSVIEGVTGTLFDFGDLDALESEVRRACRDRADFGARYPQCREAVAERFAQSAVWRRYADVFLANGEAAATVAPGERGKGV